MKPRAYYNDFEPYVCEWLRELIKAELIADGDVDNRSIRDVQPEDLRGYTQCHFFAGIGGWSYALRLAQWPDDRPVWTGSCPCQPFSSAGAQKAEADPRHLWPELFRLISECSPSIVFGEQVASKLGRNWLAGVRADLEGVGYAVGAADLCAAGVQAPHIRQRLYWLADANLPHEHGRTSSGQQPLCDFDSHGASGLAEPYGKQRGGITNSQRCEPYREARRRDESDCILKSGIAGRYATSLGDTAGERFEEQWREYRPRGERHSGLVGLAMQVGVPEWNGSTVAVKCSDGPRRVSAEPDAFPLAHGVSGRMGRLRGYGNAIVPQVAAEFIGAYLDVSG